MIYQRQFSSEQNKNIARSKDALGRLRANPTDPVAVMTLYETCSRELQEVAVQYFGKTQLGKKAVLNLLVAVVCRAMFCYLKPYLNDVNKSYFRQLADGEL